MNSVKKEKGKRLNKKSVDNLFVLSVLIIPLISFAIFYVYVNLNSFVLAFQSVDIYGNYEWVGLGNIKEFLQGLQGDSRVGLSIKNSLIYWSTSFFISMPLYLLFSYYVYKKNFGHSMFFIIVMLPNIVASFVYSLVYKMFVDAALPSFMATQGFANFPSLIYDDRTNFGNNIFYSIWLSFGTSTLVYTNAMRGINDEIIESAQLDGANNFYEFFFVVLPLIWPTISTFVITGVTSIFTASGSLILFYNMGAPTKLWGFSYYITYTVKTAMGSDFSSYPAVAASGLCVTLVTLPVVFFVKWLCNKLDRTEA